MQNVLGKHGFIKCGTIYLKNGSPRLAFHFVKKED
jgi:predicted GNAT family N-acyltransferase